MRSSGILRGMGSMGQMIPSTCLLGIFPRARSPYIFCRYTLRQKQKNSTIKNVLIDRMVARRRPISKLFYSKRKKHFLTKSLGNRTSLNNHSLNTFFILQFFGTLCSSEIFSWKIYFFAFLERWVRWIDSYLLTL